MPARTACLILLLVAVISGCGSTGTNDEKEEPEYASTPRKALESWVTAVRAGDIEMMCRLLGPRSGCDAPDKRAFMETKFLPHVRAQMRGLKGDLRYGAVDIGAPENRIVIGVVSGESPIAYAVPVRRGMTQWSIKEEPGFFGFPRIVLNRPDPAFALASGRTDIAFTAWASDSGSNYPNARLWIDSRHVNGRLDTGDDNPFGLERVRWIGAARLLPGRHVMVAAVKGEGGIARASAWVLTVH